MSLIKFVIYVMRPWGLWGSQGSPIRSTSKFIESKNVGMLWQLLGTFIGSKKIEYLELSLGRVCNS